MRRALVTVVLFAVCWTPSGFTTPALPNKAGSLKFAVLGDNGTGDRLQYDLAAQMAGALAQFPFEFVIMMGDNFYGSQRPADLVQKFDRPYKPLLDAGVTFHAALGNHDEPDSLHYPPLSMNGRRYYTFARRNVRFVVLDTNQLDTPQLEWFESALRDSHEEWTIAYFHHPLYSNAGRHGSAVDVRLLLEPILLRYGVQVVFSGHDHIYERLKPQKGIHYFVSGAGGKLRRGDVRPSPTTAAKYDEDCSFMLVEVDGAEMFFQVISRTGATVDSGTIGRQRHAGTDEEELP
jgi:hypothetical protein